MRKFTVCFILLLFFVFLSSCKIKLGSDSDNGEEQNFLHDPQPADNASGVSLTPQLNWIYNDSSSYINFDIYLDTINPPNKLLAHVNSNSYFITSPLLSNKTYFWRVRSLFNGNQYESNIWRFTTTNMGGSTIYNPNPPDSAKDISLTPQLSWNYNGSSNNLRYDIYLDTINPPFNFISEVYNPYYFISSPLTGNRTYYWQIKAIYNYGVTYSNVWRFTTVGLPTNGLVAYYPFNGNTIDESGNNNNGLNYGATLTMDRFYNSNSAYYFNGSNSYINVTHSSSIQPTTGLTLSAWVMFYRLDYTSCLLGKGYDNTAGYYGLWYDSTYQCINFQMNFPNNSQNNVSLCTTLQYNTWYHITGTFDGSTMNIYFNGQFYNSLNVSGTLGSNYADLKIGRNASGHFFNGNLDDIRIFNRAITDNEVLQLYNEGGLKKNNKYVKK